MSLLNPGGLRAAPFSRVFGFENIKRACNQGLKARDHQEIARTSIATGNRRITRIGPPYDCAPHEHKREIARRLRQASRAASGMEARRAAADNTDAVHDSPTGEAGDAQTPSAIARGAL